MGRLAARWGEHGRVGRVGQGDDDDETRVLLCAVRGEDRGKEEHHFVRAGDAKAPCPTAHDRSVGPAGTTS